MTKSEHVQHTAVSLADRAVHSVVAVPFARVVDMLLALHWGWYGLIAWLPAYERVSNLLAYLAGLGISARLFGGLCLVFCAAKLVALWREALRWRIGLLVGDLALAMLFATTSLLTPPVTGADGSSVILAALVVLTLLKTVLTRGSGR